MKIMNNLWLEFIINKFIDDQIPNARCCGSCQGGMINPALCLFMCMGITNERIHEWYTWQDKTKLREEFERQMEEEYIKHENC